MNQRVRVPPHQVRRFVWKGFLLIPLLLLPWFFGGIHVWGQYALALAVVVGLSYWMFEYRGERRPLPLAMIPLILAVLLGFFHLIPLRHSGLSSLSPAAANAWRHDGTQAISESGFQQMVGHVATTTQTTISLYPASTRHDLAFLLLAIGLFYLGSQLFNRGTSQKLLWGAVAVNGAAFAFFGIAQQLVWRGQLYGEVVLTGGGSPFAAFVNRNNAAGYLNLCLAAAIGFVLFCFAKDQACTSAPASQSLKTFLDSNSGIAKNRTREVWESLLRAFGQLDGLKLASILATVVIFSGILCSLSRGGWISAALAAVVVVTALATARRIRYFAWASLAVLVAGLSLVQWLGRSEVIGDRWQSLYSDAVQLNDGRLSHWPVSLQTARDYWLTGSGLGTYRYAYRPYVESAETVWFFHAENQYLEALVEAGVPGLALLVATIVLMSVACRRLLREPRHSSAQVCGIVGTFALVSQVAHGFFDFGLYLPANMALFALMCGSVAGRAARLESKSKGKTGRFWAFNLPLSFNPRAIVQPGLATALLFASLFGCAEIRKASATESALRPIRDLAPVSDMSIAETDNQISELGLALNVRPDDAEAHLAMARLFVRRYRLQALQVLRQQADPGQIETQLWSMTSPIALHGLVHRYQREGRSIELDNLRRSEAVQTDLKGAAGHLLRSCGSCPLLPDAYLLLAEISPLVATVEFDTTLLAQARRLAGGNIELLRECGFAQLNSGNTTAGLACFRRVAEMDPRQIAAVMRIASDWIEPQLIVNEGLPASPMLLLSLAREQFVDPQHHAMRTALLKRASEVAVSADMESAERLQFEASILEMQGRDAEAVEALARAVQHQPDSTEWRFQLASLLRRQGDLELAWEHARTCVRMDPTNQRFDALLRELIRARLASS